MPFLDVPHKHRPGRFWDSASLLIAALMVWLADGAGACADFSDPQPGLPSPSVGKRRALIVCGLPGDDEHRQLFAATVEKLHKALTERYGFAGAEVLVRFGAAKEAGDGPAGGFTRAIKPRGDRGRCG